jgi:hypothetical protein
MRAALPYLCLPTHNLELKEQLCSPEYSFSRTSDAIQLESKDLMKRRGCPSPDLADALACTFAAELATLPEVAEWAQPRGAVSEYDPFSNDAILGRPLPEAQPKFYEPGWARLKNENQEGWDRQDFSDVMASDRLRWAGEPGEE